MSVCVCVSVVLCVCRCDVWYCVMYVCGWCEDLTLVAPVLLAFELGVEAKPSMDGLLENWGQCSSLWCLGE